MPQKNFKKPEHMQEKVTRTISWLKETSTKRETVNILYLHTSTFI